MNKLKLSKLLSAVDAFYRTAGGKPQDLASAQNLTNSRIQSINAINAKQLGTIDKVREYVAEVINRAKLDLDSNLISNDQYRSIVEAGKAKNEASEAVLNPKATPASTKPAGLKLTDEQRWGTKDQQAMIAEVQKFLMGILGKEAFGPYGADGKWGPKSQAALRTWLTHSGKTGTGYLDKEALAELSKHIPSIRKYYTDVFKEDPILGF